jgi:DNA replication protein DnaC
MPLFAAGGGVFTDEQMAAAMIDRLNHHGHVLLLEGQRYRMKHAVMRKQTSSRKNTGIQEKDHES